MMISVPTIFRFSECTLSVLPRIGLRLLVALAGLLVVFLPNSLWAWPSVFFESDPLQRKIDGIKAVIDTLPVSPMHSSPWTFGYASSWDQLPDSPVTIEIKFRKSEVIDLVVILPATHIDIANVKQSFGFPVRFAIERLLPDGSVEMIANHLDADYPDPGMGPQLFHCPHPVPTDGLRITVTRLAQNPTWWETSHLVALSELFAFVGERNAALHAEVTASSSFDLPDAWGANCLTDGFSLYSPAKHQLSDPTRSFRGFGDEVRLEMDLGVECRIDEFRLWPVVRGAQFNYPMQVGVGFPQSFRVELASTPDYSDAKVVYDEKQLALIAGAGPYMRQVDPTSGRYVRITLKDGVREFRRDNAAMIALGEIELLERGRVVSSGLPVLAPGYEARTEGLDLLTDGIVSEGEIVPLRQWLIQFHQRVSLFQELRSLWPVATEARIRDGNRLIVILFIGIGVIVTLGQLIWLVRVGAHRRWAKMRERIACDLHDEIGANVSSIAHTAELLKESIHEPSKIQSRLLFNLIDSAHLTTRETKHFVRFIENEEQDRNITEQFAQVASRILGTIPAKFSLENTGRFNALDPTTKWNLLLFMKEALNNIIKHANATVVEIQTRGTGASLILEISDNGVGMAAGLPKCRHLGSRAKALGGQLEVRSRPAEGTRVILTFNRKSKL